MIPAMSDMSDKETDNPVYADERDFFKVEKWTVDGLRVDSLLYAGNNLGKARMCSGRRSIAGHRLG